MFFNIFSNEKKKANEEDKKEANKEKEKEGSKDKKTIERKEILAYSIDSKEELRRALNGFKQGRLTLVGIQNLKKKNKGKARDLVRELLSFTKKRKGQILGVGKDHLLLAPKHFSLRVNRSNDAL